MFKITILSLVVFGVVCQEPRIYADFDHQQEDYDSIVERPGNPLDLDSYYVPNDDDNYDDSLEDIFGEKRSVQQRNDEPNCPGFILCKEVQTGTLDIINEYGVDVHHRHIGCFKVREVHSKSCLQEKDMPLTRGILCHRYQECRTQEKHIPLYDKEGKERINYSNGKKLFAVLQNGCKCSERATR